MPKPRVVAVHRHRDPVARVLDLLEREGFEITVAGSEAEALKHAHPPVVVLLENPPVERCPDALCGWIRHEIRPVPPMVAVMSGWDGHHQLDRCRECLALFFTTSSPDEIAQAVRDASVWWPGDV